MIYIVKEQSMKLIINGKEQEVPKDQLTVTELLTINEVKQPDMVSVQVNGEFVERTAFESHAIYENDQVDFLYFMGGGQ
jgi:sulfur carrier protein